LIEVAKAKQIKEGEFRVVTRFEKPSVLIEITRMRLEDKINGSRIINGNCVLTGDEWIHGLYTEGLIARVGPPLNEMEVLAWVSK